MSGSQGALELRPLALWRSIHDHIHRLIRDGKLEPNARLPTEAALMQEFDVSRSTVRQALKALQATGLVRIEQGRGSFVHESLLQYPISQRTRYSENLIKQGRAPRKRRIEEAIIPASEEVASALQIAPGSNVVRVYQINFADEEVVGLAAGYLPSERFPDVLAVRRRLNDLTKVYAFYGIADYRRLVTYISARLPTVREARLLHQRRSTPVIEHKKVDVDEAGRPIGYSENVWASERVRLVVPGQDVEFG